MPPFPLPRISIFLSCCANIVYFALQFLSEAFNSFPVAAKPRRRQLRGRRRRRRTFNSFPVAAQSRWSGFEHDVNVTFQFFPSCYWRIRLRCETNAPLASFNSFPVATYVRVPTQLERFFKTFQFFPSCYGGARAEELGRKLSEEVLKSLSILSQLLRSLSRGTPTPPQSSSSTPFNSFPVATKENGTEFAVIRELSFQFFPSCYAR